MKLIHLATKKEAKVGDLVKTRDGELAKLTYFTKPHKPSSEGKVSVEYSDGVRREYYVSVFGLEWIEREDRE